MIGRQVIVTNRALTLAELYAFMEAHWDRERYNDFVTGRPTPASIEEYILLPATERYGVIAYARAAGGLFNKVNKVILCVCENTNGAWHLLYRAMPTKNLFYAHSQNTMTRSMEKERKGPVEEILQGYAAYMRELLHDAGLC